MSARPGSPWQGRTRRQKRAAIESRTEVKHPKAVSQLKTGGSPAEIKTKKLKGAQQLPLQARKQVEWVEPQEVEEPVLDGANFLHALDQVDAWFQEQTTKYICPCGTVQ